jgi:hypothetical protein
MAKTRATIIGIVAAALVAFVGHRIHVMRSDVFDAQLTCFAGPDSIHLGTYTDWSPELEMKMADCLTNGQRFWARSNRLYRNVHNTNEQWNVSEGFVLAPDGKLYRIDWYPPTFWANPRMRTLRIDSPRVVTHVVDKDYYYYIEMYETSPVVNPL